MSTIGNYEEFEAFSKDLARNAGKLLLQQFLKPQEVRYKSGDRRNPVTEADTLSESYLVEAIKSKYPDHSILGEEGIAGNLKESEYLWVLDPLDGTTNFLNGIPLFAVSIALLHEGIPVAAAIFMPDPNQEQGTIYHAHAGGGSYQDGHRIYIESNPLPGSGYVAFLPSRYSRFLYFKGSMSVNHGEVRGLGSIACEIALVSKGTAQYGVFTGPRLWDIAAGVLLVIEAGGMILIGDKLKDWQPFTNFPYPVLGRDGQGKEITDWVRPTLAGNAAVVSHVATRLRQRSRRWARIKRWVRQIGKKQA